ncbi:MAG: hypothetical protein WDZ83_10300 [Rhizobiaceae bacterium]
MHAANLSRVAMTCRQCGALNELIAADVPEGQDIHCSRCGNALGTWHELRDAKKAETPAPPEAHGRVVDQDLKRTG